jgi:hypothetical protein
MSDENFVSLKEYLIEKQKAMGELMLVRLDALNAIFDLKIDSMNKATDIYKATTSAHLIQMNEFRSENKDLLVRFATKETLEAYIAKQCEIIKTINEKIDVLESNRDKLEGKASQKALLFTQAFTIVGILIALLSLVIKLM